MPSELQIAVKLAAAAGELRGSPGVGASECVADLLTDLRANQDEVPGKAA